ncbi:AraC family transcriptional regulator [Persicobacter diffluens]
MAEILTRALAQFDEEGQREEGISLATKNALNDLEVYINENLHENILVEDLCRRIGFSKTKLHHLFKGHFGHSIYDHIKIARIRKAKSLLVTSDLAVAEIAVFVGYQSVPHFSNVFKKNVGITPIQFRKGYRRELSF